MLAAMFNAQTKFLDEKGLLECNSEESKQLIMVENIDNAIEELVEVRRELPYRKYWKPHKFKDFNRNLVKEEIIDALRFILNVCIYAGFNSVDVYQMFIKSYEKTKNYKEMQ